MRLNNANQTLATAMYLHHTNALNIDISNALKMLEAGNTLLLQDKTNAANYRMYRVSAAITDFATYTEVPVTYLSGGAAVTAGRVMLAAFGMGGSVSNGIIPQNSKSAAYTTVLTDAGKHIFHPSADTTARTWTIDSNANVAYAVGTAITFVNQNSAGVITIAITADTLRLASAGTTGNRTLAANGVATALKVTSTEWLISGTGLT
jgi:hypothetical protein